MAAAAVFVGASAAARKPYITPGSHLIFRMDSTPGAMLEFLVLLSVVIAAVITLSARRARWVSPCIAAAYAAGLLLVSLGTPEKVVSVGDSYCWDLWCIGVQNVSAFPQGESVVYRADVSLFVDSATAQLELKDQPNQFFYAMDESGRRFPVRAASPGSSVTVKPGDLVKGSLSFVAPAGAKNLYLAGDMQAPLWVRLYFGSDLNPFHRRTLLRVI